MRLITIDHTLTVTPIKDDDNLLNTIDSHIKLRKLKEVMLLCWIIKLLSISSADKYSKKHLEVCEADALKQVDANVREEENKNRSSLYYSDSNSDTAIGKTRIKAYSLLDSDDYCLDSSLDIDSEDDLEDEEATTLTTVHPANKQTRMRDSLSARNKRIMKLLARAYILYFKELLSDNGRIFASVIGITRTRAIKNEVVAIDPANSILCDLSDLLVVRFCIFSDSALENIGILTNEEVVEMQTNTATALANELAAVNKLFALVCGFRKVDRHVFRADNTISVTAQRTITFIRIFESITKDTNGKHRLCLERSSAVDKVTGKHTYKTYINGLVINRQWRDVVANVRCSAD
ncbi:hypothetical protein HBI64_000150 [Parastagonospora nodorum]|nr:hypothetical protein HBI64_000150 [Parastagonospora nodorum]